MGTQRRRSSGEVGARGDASGSRVFLSPGAAFRQGQVLERVNALGVSSKTWMRRSGCEVWKMAISGSGFERAALIYSRIELQRATWA